MQQQRILLGTGCREIPELVLGEPLSLGMNPKRLVVGNHHGRRGVAPRGGLLVVDTELDGDLRRRSKA